MSLLFSGSMSMVEGNEHEYLDLDSVKDFKKCIDEIEGEPTKQEKIECFDKAQDQFGDSVDDSESNYENHPGSELGASENDSEGER